MFIIQTLKINGWNMSSWRFGRWFSFLNVWFVSSMLIYAWQTAIYFDHFTVSKTFGIMYLGSTLTQDTSHHQDYYIRKRSNPKLNLYLWLIRSVGQIQHVIKVVSKPIPIKNIYQHWGQSTMAWQFPSNFFFRRCLDPLDGGALDSGQTKTMFLLLGVRWLGSTVDASEIPNTPPGMVLNPCKIWDIYRIVSTGAGFVSINSMGMGWYLVLGEVPL